MQDTSKPLPKALAVESRLYAAVGAIHYVPMDDPASALGVIGLDIGGTKIAVGLATEQSGRLQHRVTGSTPAARHAEGVLETADALIAETLGVARARNIAVSGIGISVPETVNTLGGISSEAVIEGLWAIDFRTRYCEFEVVTVESDVRAAAVAEARSGAGRAFDSFCYISVGTGISYCLVQDGVAWRGSTGSAILLGSSVMAQWREDGLVRQWVLEEIASGPALFARYKALGGQASSVRAVLDSYGTDTIAGVAVDEAASALGIGLATLVNLLDPECLVVGGGLGAARGPHFELAVASARAHIWSHDARNIHIVRAECGEDSAVVGAAMLAMDHVAEK